MLVRRPLVALAATAATVTLLVMGFSKLYAQSSPASSLQVNFQPSSSTVPAGYTEDTGAAYTNERGSGWVSQDSLSDTTATPLDVTPNSRDRNRSGIDPRLNTLIHMQFPDSTFNESAVRIPAAWELALPDGAYSVHVGVGDQPSDNGVYDSQHSLNVEGVGAIDRFEPSTAREYAQALVRADITDGKLTVDAIGGTNTKINFLQIASYPGFPAVTWGNAAASPIARSEAQGGFANGKLYVISGYIDSTYKPTKRSDVYNPASNSWARVADLPVATTHAGTAIVGKDIYLAGGYAAKSNGSQAFSSKNVWKYDTAANSWTALPALPVARGSGALVELGGELHFFGGADSNRLDKGEHWFLRLNGGTSWTSVAPIPDPRSHMGYASLGGKIYAIGGQHGIDANLVTQASVYVWDPATGAWSQVASLPTGRSHISSTTFVMDNRIVVLGGEIAHTKPVPDVTAYDPLTNGWTALTPLPAKRHSGVGGGFGDRLYYTTGGLSIKTTYRGTPGYNTSAALTPSKRM
ncbi:MAG: hypothetical protein H7Y22_09435 [Gemmatimonadaceae bacterium]|nr:hypothetical protein [Gloeobacterales cyanobacterium ES-bin-141]